MTEEEELEFWIDQCSKGHSLPAVIALQHLQRIKLFRLAAAAPRGSRGAYDALQVLKAHEQ